jgi:hypothetical protein
MMNFIVDKGRVVHQKRAGCKWAMCGVWLDINAAHIAHGNGVTCKACLAEIEKRGREAQVILDKVSILNPLDAPTDLEPIRHSTSATFADRAKRAVWGDV